VIKRARVTALTHIEQDDLEILHNRGKLVEVSGNAPDGYLVANKHLVHCYTHKLESLNAAELYTGRSKVKFLLVYGTGEQVLTAKVVQSGGLDAKLVLAPGEDDVPIIENIVRVGDDWG